MSLVSWGRGGGGDKWNNVCVFWYILHDMAKCAYGRDWESGRSWNEIPTSTSELTHKSKFFIYFPRKKGWNFETSESIEVEHPKDVVCNLGVDLVLPLVGTHYFRVRCFKPVDSPKKNVWHPERPSQLVIRNDFCLQGLFNGKFSDSIGRIFLFSRVHGPLLSISV